MVSYLYFGKEDQPDLNAIKGNNESSVLKEDSWKIIEDGAVIRDGVHTNLTCNSEHCSLYGIKLAKYISDLHPVKPLILPEIVDGNRFLAGKDLSFMSHKNVRFVMYYWFGENIYMFFGKGNW